MIAYNHPSNFPTPMNTWDHLKESTRMVVYIYASMPSHPCVGFNCFLDQTALRTSNVGDSPLATSWQIEKKNIREEEQNIRKEPLDST